MTPSTYMISAMILSDMKKCFSGIRRKRRVGGRDKKTLVYHLCQSEPSAYDSRQEDSHSSVRPQPEHDPLYRHLLRVRISVWTIPVSADSSGYAPQPPDRQDEIYFLTSGIFHERIYLFRSPETPSGEAARFNAQECAPGPRPAYGTCLQYALLCTAS